MSSAPLERLAARQAQYSQEQGDAEERMLGNLAQIPETAMRTAERIQRMRANDLASQMRVESVEQKRMELDRRFYEASALYRLRTEQAAAQQAKVAADSSKLALEKERFAWQKEIGTKRENRLTEEGMDEDYYRPIREPETGRIVVRVKPGVVRDATQEEKDYLKELERAPGVLNQQRERMGEAAVQRAKQGPAAKTPLQRFNTAALSLKNLSTDMLLLPAEEKAKRMEEMKAMHAEMGDAMKDMEADRAAAPAPMPDDLRGILNEEQYATLRQTMDEAAIRERLKKAGRLK